MTKPLVITDHYRLEEETVLTEIPLGAVSQQARFRFDSPQLVRKKDRLGLLNGNWYLIRPGEEPRMIEGMWKVKR